MAVWAGSARTAAPPSWGPSWGSVETALADEVQRGGIAAWKALRDLLPRDEDVPSGAPTVGIGQLFIAAHKEINRQEHAKSIQVGSASKASRVLDPEEVKFFMKQGGQFSAAGDVVTARIVFQRTAEAGDANAAMALGATYDPTVLAKLGVAGLGADVEQARTWYQKASARPGAWLRRRKGFVECSLAVD